MKKYIIVQILLLAFLKPQITNAAFTLTHGTTYIPAANSYWGAGDYNTITIVNGDVEVVFTKDPYFSMHSLKYKGQEFLYTGNARAHGYWSIESQDSSSNCIYYPIYDTNSQWVRRDTADFKEIRWEIPPLWQDGSGNIITLRRLRIHFIFKKDDPGFYVYMEARDLGGYTQEQKNNCRIGLLEWKMRLQADDNFFCYNFNRNGIYDYLPPSYFPDGIDYDSNDSRYLMDATYMIPAENNSIYTKYDYCFDSSKGEHLLNGFISRSTGGYRYGIWLIQASDEWMCGTPYKQELCCHLDEYSPALLFLPRTGHYGQLQEPLDPDAGWCRVYGPVYYYFNRTSSVSDVRTLYYDASGNILPAQQTMWPFEANNPILENNNYTYRGDRKTISGTISITNLPQGVTPPGWIKVILSKPQADSNERNMYDNKGWYLNSKSLVFSTKIPSGSGYNIPNVVPGTYGVYVIAQNILEERYAGNITIGGSNVTKNIVWSCNRQDKTKLLTIGIADHNCQEFYGGDYRHFGDWFQGYPAHFGDTCKAHWYSNAPNSDNWPYTQWIWVTTVDTAPFLHRSVNGEWNDTFLENLINKPESHIHITNHPLWTSSNKIYVRVATTAASYATLSASVYVDGVLKGSQDWGLTNVKDSSGYRSGNFGICRITPSGIFEFAGNLFDQTYPYETVIVLKLKPNLIPDFNAHTYTSNPAGANHESSVTYDCVQIEYK